MPTYKGNKIFLCADNIQLIFSGNKTYVSGSGNQMLTDASLNGLPQRKPTPACITTFCVCVVDDY